MKKLVIPVMGLMMILSAGTSMANVSNTTVAVAENEKTQIKPEELPEPIKKTLAGDDYKGWTVSTAYLVKAEASHYEINVANGKETKTLKFTADGKAVQ